MSLITCPDCKKQVSNQAPACPNCGRPIAKTDSQAASQNIKVKKSGGGLCKILQLIGAIMLCFGVLSCIYNTFDIQKGPSLTPTVMIIGGFFIFVIGRFFE